MASRLLRVKTSDQISLGRLIRNQSTCLFLNSIQHQLKVARGNEFFGRVSLKEFDEEHSCGNSMGEMENQIVGVDPFNRISENHEYLC
jgi:hypothetical protein